MSARRVDGEQRLSRLLDEALADLRAGGRMDAAAYQARHPELAVELPALLQVLQDFEHAAQTWKPAATPAEPGADSAAPADVPLPHCIGRYRILETIGIGGMGTVYKAHDPQLDRIVAVKVPRLDEPAPDRAGRVQRFLLEARAAAQLRHSHVCPIYDVGECAGLPYVVMALVQGESLAQRLRRQGHFDNLAEAARLVLQVAQAVGVAHEHGIIHRDIKPGNILLDADGRALLTDFGLARAAPRGAAPRCEPSTAELLVGTPAYMAPEQAAGDSDRVGPWTDWYSLSVVLYQLITGRLPHDGPPLTLLHSIVHEAPAPLSRWRPDVQPALETFLHKALAKRPQERFQNAREFADALERALEGRTAHERNEMASGLIGAPETSQPQSPRGRRITRLAAAAVALALLIGCAILLAQIILRLTDEKGNVREIEVKPGERLEIAPGRASNAWVRKAPLPTPRDNVMAAEINGILYVVGGNIGLNDLDLLQAYNPAADKWKELTAIGKRRDVAGSPGRYGGAVGVIDGKLYLAGGWQDSPPGRTSGLPSGSLFIYDPAKDAWHQGPEMPILSAGSAAGVVAGKLYVLTTQDGWSEHGIVNLLHVYDPHAQAWRELGRGAQRPKVKETPGKTWQEMDRGAPGAYAGRAAAVIDSKLYVVGGWAAKDVSAALDVYDPIQRSWSAKQRMPTPRYRLATAVVDGKLYAVGGEDRFGNPLDKVEAFDPVANTWTSGPPLGTPRVGLAAVAIGTTIYAVGGSDQHGPSAAVEALDTAKVRRAP